MPILPDYLKITDLSALKALSDITQRRDGEIKIVDAVSSTSPEYNLKDVLYRYSINSTASAIEPAVVAPDDNNGRWFMVSDAIAFSTTPPAAAPAKENITYVAILDNPPRKTKWVSPQYLTPTPLLADWQPVLEPIEIPAPPSFNADFNQQLVKDVIAGYVYEAIDLNGNWKLSIPHNGFIYGDDLSTPTTLGAIDFHGQYKKVVANLTLTLPAGLGANIESRLIVSTGINLTLSPDDASGASLNGSSSDVVVTEKTIVLHNDGDDWFS